MKVPQFFKRKSIRYGLAGFASSFFAFALYLGAKPIVQEYQSSFAAKEFKEYGVYGAYKHRFFSFIDKLDEMKGLDQENQDLSAKVAMLEKEIETDRAKGTEVEAKEETVETSKRLQAEAGSELARVLKGIEYQPPTNLLPNQLYSLAVGYFRKQEYEQAAVILSKLVDLKEDSSYQKAESQMMCAIAWYKLKHFKLAKQYLGQVKYKSVPTDAVYRTALVWEALTAKAEGRTEDAQQMVTAIISRYPHSEEAALVNTRAHSARVPASREKEGSMVLQRKLDSEPAHHEETHEAKSDHHSEHAEPAHGHEESRHDEAHHE